MNDIFNPKRFCAYLRYDLIRNQQSFGLAILILGLIPVIIYLLCGIFCTILDLGWIAPNEIVRWIIYCLTTMIFIFIYPSKVYGFITERRAGANFLMLPVSITEKYLSILLHALVIAPLAYMILYFGSDGILCIIDPNCGTPLWRFGCINAYRNLMTNLNAMTATSLQNINPIFNIIMNTVNNMLIFVLGALWFSKHKIGKTILSLIVINIALSLLTTPLMLGQMTKQYGDFSGTFDALLETYYVIASIGAILLAIILAILIFLRLKTIKH